LTYEKRIGKTATITAVVEFNIILPSDDDDDESPVQNSTF
jgi:hypothetical protein